MTKADAIREKNCGKLASLNENYYPKNKIINLKEQLNF